MRRDAVLCTAVKLRMTAVFSDAVRRGFIYRDEVENDRSIDRCGETRFLKTE